MMGRYTGIHQNFKGIVFMGTPHRGAKLAKLLKMILHTTFAKRRFVNQLIPQSETITRLNEAFRHRATSFQLVSFWESTGMTGVDVCPKQTSAYFRRL